VDVGITFQSYKPRAAASLAQPVYPDAADFAAARLGFTPDPQQAAVLRTPGKRVLLACARQWGKSTTAAAKAVHHAWTRPRSLILIVSPGERQSAEFLNKATSLAENLGFRIRGDGDNPISILFPNRSRIVGLPGVARTSRGFSAASLLIIEEASELPDRVYNTLRPTLAVSNGDLWVIGTPSGKRGFFYEEWAYGGDRWTRLAVRATECPRYSREFLEEERETRPDAWFRQEYLCEFIDDGEGVFTREQVEAALDDTLEPLNNWQLTTGN
jgi:hypothetical protein